MPKISLRVCQSVQLSCLVFHKFSKIPVFLSALVREKKICTLSSYVGISPILLKSQLHLRRLPVLQRVPAAGRPFRKCIFCVFERTIQVIHFPFIRSFFVLFCFPCKVTACFDLYILQLVTDLVISLHNSLFSHFHFFPFQIGTLDFA